MSTQRIEHKDYSYNQPQARKPVNGADFSLFPDGSNTRQEENTGSGTCLHDRIKAILAKVPRDQAGLLSFQDVIDHHAVSRKAWTELVIRDLRNLGVDVSTSIRLVHDAASAQVTAVDDHPDASRIDQYFADRPVMVGEFDRILSLGKLADAVRRLLAPEELTKRMTRDDMAAWYCEHMDSAALLSGGGMVIGQDSGSFHGLDIRV